MPSRTILCLLLVWGVGFTFAATSTKQFKDWYPRYGFIFSNITRINCSTEYEKYLTGVKNHAEIVYMAGGGIYTALTQPVVECILKHTSEFLKGSMTGAQILLGVMPTIVALLGPSHDEIAMLSNVGRRPLLAAGIALASPSAYFSRAFEYADPAKILNHDPGKHPQWRPTNPLVQLLVSLLEYVLISATCWNVLSNTFEVSLRTINSFASDTDFLPNVWLALGFCIHVFSGVVFRLRLQGERIKNPAKPRKAQWDPIPKGPDNPVCRVVNSFLNWVGKIGQRLTGLALTEFVPCAAAGWVVHIRTFTETKIFLFVAWWQSTFTVLHVVFGTLVFSGMLFVGIQDAMTIVGRYIAGVAVARVVLMYELAGVRECWVLVDDEVRESDSKDGLQARSEGKKSETIKDGSIARSRPEDYSSICP